MRGTGVLQHKALAPPPLAGHSGSVRREEDEEIERLAEQRRLAAGYRIAARRAIAFARLYREEEGSGGGPRERACVEQALAWREAARGVASTPDSACPGLARTRPSAVEERRAAKRHAG